MARRQKAVRDDSKMDCHLWLLLTTAREWDRSMIEPSSRRSRAGDALHAWPAANGMP